MMKKIIHLILWGLAVVWLYSCSTEDDKQDFTQVGQGKEEVKIWRTQTAIGTRAIFTLCSDQFLVGEQIEDNCFSWTQTQGTPIPNLDLNEMCPSFDSDDLECDVLYEFMLETWLCVPMPCETCRDTSILSFIAPCCVPEEPTVTFSTSNNTCNELVSYEIDYSLGFTLCSCEDCTNATIGETEIEVLVNGTEWTNFFIQGQDIDCQGATTGIYTLDCANLDFGDIVQLQIASGQTYEYCDSIFTMPQQQGASYNIGDCCCDPTIDLDSPIFSHSPAYCNGNGEVIVDIFFNGEVIQNDCCSEGSYEVEVIGYNDGVVFQTLSDVSSSGTLSLDDELIIPCDATNVTVEYNINHGGGSCDYAYPENSITFTVDLSGASNCLSCCEDYTITETIIDDNCAMDGIGAIDIEVSGNTPPYSYNWSNGEMTQDITDLMASNYTVTITSSDNPPCVEEFTFMVGAEPCCNPVSCSISATDTEVCEGDCVDITAIGTDGDGALTFTWSTGFIEAGVTTSTINVCATGTYSVTVTDAPACNSTAVCTIDINPIPECPQVSILNCNDIECNDLVTFDASDCANAVSEVWEVVTPSDITINSAGPILINEEGIYNINVTQIDSCGNVSTASCSFEAEAQANLANPNFALDFECNGDDLPQVTVSWLENLVCECCPDITYEFDYELLDQDNNVLANFNEDIVCGTNDNETNVIVLDCEVEEVTLNYTVTQGGTACAVFSPNLNGAVVLAVDGTTCDDCCTPCPLAEILPQVPDIDCEENFSFGTNFCADATSVTWTLLYDDGQGGGAVQVDQQVANAPLIPADFTYNYTYDLPGTYTLQLEVVGECQTQNDEITFTIEGIQVAAQDPNATVSFSCTGAGAPQICIDYTAFVQCICCPNGSFDMNFVLSSNNNEIYNNTTNHVCGTNGTFQDCFEVACDFATEVDWEFTFQSVNPDNCPIDGVVTNESGTLFYDDSVCNDCCPDPTADQTGGLDLVCAGETVTLCLEDIVANTPTWTVTWSNGTVQNNLDPSCITVTPVGLNNTYTATLTNECGNSTVYTWDIDATESQVTWTPTVLDIANCNANNDAEISLIFTNGPMCNACLEQTCPDFYYEQMITVTHDDGTFTIGPDQVECGQTPVSVDINDLSIDWCDGDVTVSVDWVPMNCPTDSIPSENWTETYAASTFENCDNCDCQDCLASISWLDAQCAVQYSVSGDCANLNWALTSGNNGAIINGVGNRDSLINTKQFTYIMNHLLHLSHTIIQVFQFLKFLKFF